MNNKQKPQLPLVGIRVVEFCEVAAGPFCAMLLADMGAEVIKVERESGDAMRSWPPIREGVSENFASINRNKKSIVLDLKSTEGLAAAKALIESADVVLENFRPGVMARNGIGYEDTKKINKRVIYCSISAFGQTGPRSREGGFDLTMQAMAGVMSVTGEADGAPVKCGVPLCDFVSALYGAFAVVSAMQHRQVSGEGQHIDIAMLGATLAIGALQTSEYFGTGKDPVKLGSAHPRNAPYQAFQASNGYFGMAAGNNNLWNLVCDAMNITELKENPAYATPTERAKNQKALREILEAQFAEQPVAHWLEIFTAAGVPCSPINTYSQALDDPQVKFMEWVQTMELINGLSTQTFASPIRINGQTGNIRHRPPGLGEHTKLILDELSL